MGTINQTITEYTGTAPNKATQTPAEFSANADTEVEFINNMPGELNTFASQANSLRSDCNAAQAAAETSKAGAEAAQAAAEAASNATKWVSGTTYSAGAVVYGSDYLSYRSAQGNNLGHDPVGDGGTWWVKFTEDSQNAIYGQVAAAIDMAGLANRELERWKTVRMQEGEVTILNRGVISGCVVSATSQSDGAGTRNLNIVGGKAFGFGTIFGAAAGTGVAAVPSNDGGADETCYAYLMVDTGGVVQCNCTALGADVPDNGVPLYQLTVPAGNNETTDPYLASVSFTDVRRIEPQWPLISQNPSWAYVPLQSILPDGEYAVYTEIQSFEGGEQQCGRARIEDRLKNGFKLYLTGAADMVRVRYVVSRVRT